MTYDSSNLQAVALGRSLAVAGVLSVLSNEAGVKTWFFIFFGLEIILGYCTVDTITRAYELGKKNTYSLIKSRVGGENWTSAIGTALILFTHYLYIALTYMLTRAAISCTSHSYPAFDWRPLPRSCIQLTTLQCWVGVGCCGVVLILALMYFIAYISAARIADRRGFTARALTMAVILQSAHIAVWMWAYRKDAISDVGIGAWRTIVGIGVVGITMLFALCVLLFWYFFATNENVSGIEAFAIFGAAGQLIGVSFLAWNAVTMAIFHVTYESIFLACITGMTGIEALFAFFFSIASRMMHT